MLCFCGKVLIKVVNTSISDDFHDFERHFEGYFIRLLRTGEEEALMQFFFQNLDPMHQLSTNVHYLRTFFRSSKERYNFLIAIDHSLEIFGALGFIDIQFYDPQCTENFIWITNWLKAEKAPVSVGLSLLSVFTLLHEGVGYGTVGNNDVAGRIYQRLGFRCGKLNQLYMVNERLSNYSLIRNPEKTCSAGNLRLQEGLIESLPNEKECIYPYKSLRYLINKYQKSPFYTYHFYSIDERAMLVIREDQYEKARVLRVVDFVGDPGVLGQCGQSIQQLLWESGAEYIDFYCFGIDINTLLASGFVLNELKETVVPSYFEPFKPENIVIQFAYKTNRPFAVFKGDGDREFPRMLRGGWEGENAAT